MDRRAFVSSFSAVALAVGLPLRARATSSFGYLDVTGHTAHRQATGETLHVFLDAVDVTSRCVVADDRAGYVELYCRDAEAHRWDVAHGAVHVSADGVAVCRHRLEGSIRIVPGEAF